jgi:mRNA interferase RelE/StbE
VAAIRALANDPRPAGCVKLTGADKYRLRTGRYRILYTVRTGRYRILYTVRDAEVILTIVRVAHRSDAYR